MERGVKTKNFIIKNIYNDDRKNKRNRFDSKKFSRQGYIFMKLWYARLGGLDKGTVLNGSRISRIIYRITDV